MNLSYNTQKWLSVFGSFMVALSLGNFYTLGNMSPYITSYLHMKVQPWFTDSYMIWVNGFFMFGDGLFMAVGGLLAPKYGNRVVILVGSIIFTGFSAFSAYTITKGFLPFCITYGLLSWIGAGINSAVIIGEIMKWFPNSKGSMSGLVVSGFGFGGFGLNAIQTKLVNPYNLLPNKTEPYAGYFTDEELLESVPNLFWKSALIILAVQLLAIPLVFTPSNESQRTPNVHFTAEHRQVVSNDPNGNTRSTTTYGTTTTSLDNLIENNEDQLGMSPKQMMKTKQFYILWFIFAFQMLPVSFLLTYYKNYNLTFIPDDHFLSYLGAIGALISCVGKILAGKMLDKTSIKFSLAVLSVGISVSVQLLYPAQFIEPHDSMTSRAYFTIFFLMGYVCVGGIYGIIAGVAGEAFGLRYAGANFGTLFSSQAVGSFAGAFLVQAMQHELQWTWLSFSSVVFFSLASLLLCCMLKSRKEQEEEALTFAATSPAHR